MIVLGIETSCDETSAAIVNESAILANIITTQEIHKKYGGVVPEFASRAHIRQLLPIIRAALSEANMTLDQIDGCAVTYGPGLAGSLLVGLSMCKGIALGRNLPWIGINHLEGHVLAILADNPVFEYPYICLLASGGHTQLVHVKEPMQYQILGSTIDDAAGEAFDKVAKILGLGYPGGPAIENMAKKGNPQAIQFPRARMGKENLDFSFSGLKTSVLYYINSLSRQELSAKLADIAASFQQAVIDVLVAKAIKSLDLYHCNNLVLAGGVARNKPLRTAFENHCKINGIDFSVPAPELCTDNAAMIARAGHIRLERGQRSQLDLDVVPNLILEQRI